MSSGPLALASHSDLPKIAAVYTAAVAPTLPFAVTRPCENVRRRVLFLCRRTCGTRTFERNHSTTTNKSLYKSISGDQGVSFLPSAVCGSFLLGTAALHGLNETQASSCHPFCLPSCPWHPSLCLKGPLRLCLTWLLSSGKAWEGLSCTSRRNASAQEQARLDRAFCVRPNGRLPCTCFKRFYL